MTIFRTAHNKNYTVINNTICTDKRLSWKAKGIWLYAFSRPDDWSFHINDLINQSIDGRDGVRSGLKELQECGYLKRSIIKNSKGQFDYGDWTFFETPQEIKEKLPQTENPFTEVPDTEKRPLLSTDVLPSTKEQQQDAVVSNNFYDCLDDVPIPESDKIWLTTHHTLEEVQYAISFASHPSTRITSTLQQCIKWAAKNNPQIPLSKEELTEKNRSISFGYITKLYSIHYTIDVSPSCIRIDPKTTGNTTIINFDENDFMGVVLNALEKHGFKEIK